MHSWRLSRLSVSNNGLPLELLAAGGAAVLLLLALAYSRLAPARTHGELPTADEYDEEEIALGRRRPRGAAARAKPKAKPARAARASARAQPSRAVPAREAARKQKKRGAPK